MLNDCKSVVELESEKSNKQMEEWIANDNFDIKISQINRVDLFHESDIKKNPDFRLKENSTITSR